MKSLEIFTIPEMKKHKNISEFCFEKLVEFCKEKFDYDVLEEKISKNEHGKPFFADNEDLHYNISHTNGLGVIVFDDRPCGVDVERIVEKKYDLSERFYSSEEKEWVNEAKTEIDRTERLLTVWTGKEAYTKMLGVGLTVDIRTINIFDKEIWNKLTYTRENEYIICVCRESED